MISDTLYEAIQEIERYQRELSDNYEVCRDHIEIVKNVMFSLQNVLDAHPGLIRFSAAEALSDDQKRWWRACCEANVARWVERLRLLGPIDSEELAGMLAGAVERQNALMNEDRGSKDDGSGERGEFLECLHVWSFLHDAEPVRRRLTELLPTLEHDANPLPVDYADWLKVPAGSTFADGVLAVREKLQPASEDEVRREVFRLACECWNKEATTTAQDALQDVLTNDPDLAEELVAPLVGHSEFWLEQIVRTAFGLPSDNTEDFDHLLTEGKRALAGRRSSEPSENV